MDPSRWQQIKKVFWGALDQPTGERLLWLQQQANCDTGLRSMVMSMLDNQLSEAADPPGPQLPDRIGAYRVESLVARRSSSLVLRAERDDGAFEQTVAIKLLLLPTLDTIAQRRFKAERRALGALRHPNICRILDSGQLEAGPPYLILEWIEGTPLLDYCRDRSPRLKLILFRQLCLAIEAAHGQLIVHRDLKPEHVLITPDGTLKVLDFGIAKLLQASEKPAIATQPGFGPLTPAYASPEQWREEPASPLMDVFSLGIILFELLSGRHPYGPSPARPHEWAERITRTQPLSLRQARAGVHRDLDAIAAKALAPPSRRYASVRDLREDLEAHLDQRPVKARGRLWFYRTSLWARRHAAAFLTGALLLLLLGVFGWQSWRASQQRLAEALRARDRAEQIALKSFATILEANLPVEARREYLDVLAAELETFDWSTLPAGEELRTAQVLTNIAAFYGEGFSTHLEDQPRAERIALQGLVLLERRWLRTPDNATAEKLMGAHVLLGDIRFTSGKYRSAISAYQSAVQVVNSQEASFRHAPLKSVALSMIGDALLALGDASSALPYQQQALAIRESYAASPAGRQDPWTPVYLGNVWLSFAQCFEALQQVEPALQAYETSQNFFLTAERGRAKDPVAAGIVGELTAEEGLARLRRDRQRYAILRKRIIQVRQQYPVEANLRRLAEKVAAPPPKLQQ